MKLSELEAVVEAILFVSGDAVSLTVIADAVGMDKATTKAIINSLAEKYESEKRGIQHSRTGRFISNVYGGGLF